MNRRTFLTGATAAAALAASGTVSAVALQGGKKLKVLIPVMKPEQVAELETMAPNVELVVCHNGKEAVENVKDADASYGFITTDLIRAGKKLKWVQQGSAGVENVVNIPELVNSEIVLTNMQRVFGPEIADQAMGYLLNFSRHLPHYMRAQAKGEWDRSSQVALDELMGKTMQIIGLGGIGSALARRAHAFGMRILATDPKVVEKPDFVEDLQKPDSFHRLLPQADVLASAVPLTPISRKMIGEKEFAMMKKGAILINVSRGGVVDTDALVRNLDSGQIGAAGLDVTDPEPLTPGHPLWSKQNVIITPHIAAQSPGGQKRTYELFRENLRKFSRGETLWNIVDKKAGY
jgi:phosphoglycerate dehydrogenase-like enzyme